MTLVLQSKYQPDPYFADVSLLLHGNGTNGSTTITDSSSSPKTVTAVGNAQISTAQSKFGGASIAFDGSGDHLTVPSGSDFNFESSSFTIEFFVRFNSLSGVSILIARRASDATVAPFLIYWNGSTIDFLCSANGSVWAITASSPAAVVANTWHHVAAVRNGNSFACYLDGAAGTAVTNSSAVMSSSAIVVIGGDTNTNYLNGYIDDLRITKGIARYQGPSFTVPAAPFADSALPAPGKLTLRDNFIWDTSIWNPSMITTALWLDAADASTITQSAGLVSQWNDKSGNARHATASSTQRPTYGNTSFNGQPGLTFNGSTNYLTANSAASVAAGNDLPFSIFIAANAAQADSVFFGFGDSGGTPGRVFHSFGLLLSTGYLYSYRRDSNALLATVNGSQVVSGNSILSLIFTGTTGTLFLNAAQTGTANMDTASLSTIDKVSIGALDRHITTDYTSGVISEVLLLSSAASTDTRQRIEGYLAHKWGLTANLPSDHPYKNVGPRP